MILRRCILIGSGLVWAGLLGTLLVRERIRANDAGRRYVDALFGEDTPVLVSESVRVREDMTGTEAQLGFLETQLVYIGSNDVHVQHSLELSPGNLPLLAKAFIMSQLPGGDAGDTLQPVKLTLDQYINRRRGLLSIKGKASYGEYRYEFAGRPSGSRHLVISSWLKEPGQQDRRLEDSRVPYDPGQPFGSGDSPFRAMKGLKEGATVQVAYLDPFTRSSVRQMIRVTGRSSVRYRGRDVDCLVLNAHPVAGGEGTGYGAPVATAWLSAEDGLVLRKEVQILMFKLAVVLEDSVTARERAYRDSLRGANLPEGPPEGAEVRDGMEKKL